MLPEVFRSFADVFPVSASIEALRGIIIYEWGWSTVISHLPVILVTPILTYIIGIYCYKLNLKRMLS